MASRSRTVVYLATGLKVSTREIRLLLLEAVIFIVKNTVPRETWYNPSLCSTSIEVGEGGSSYSL